MKPKLYKNSERDYTFVAHDGRMYTMTYQNGRIGNITPKGTVNERYQGGTVVTSIPNFLKTTVFGLNKKPV